MELCWAYQYIEGSFFQGSYQLTSNLYMTGSTFCPLLFLQLHISLSLSVRRVGPHEIIKQLCVTVQSSFECLGAQSFIPLFHLGNRQQNLKYCSDKQMNSLSKCETNSVSHQRKLCCCVSPFPHKPTCLICYKPLLLEITGSCTVLLNIWSLLKSVVQVLQCNLHAM